MSDLSPETIGSGPRPAPAGSLLDTIRQERAKRERALFVDYPVPGLADVHVRFRPIQQAEIERVNRRFEKSKDLERDLLINATILTIGCVGVWSKPDPDAVFPEDSPRFDAALAPALDLPEDAPPVEMVRKLYATDGDVISTAVRLAEWSGYTASEIDREFEGN